MSAMNEWTKLSLTTGWTMSFSTFCCIRSRQRVADVDEPADSVRGLENIGNTCYFNATMQPLVHTHFVFREELQNIGEQGEFVKEVLKFFSAMQSSDSGPCSPDDLHRLFGTKSPKFANFRQHDSHECLRNFLDNVRKEERDNSGAADKRKVLTVVDNVFGGHFMTVYMCKKCETPYHVCEALLDISLPIMIDEKDLTSMNLAHSSNEKTSRTITQQPQKSQINCTSQTNASRQSKLNGEEGNNIEDKTDEEKQTKVVKTEAEEYGSETRDSHGPRDSYREAVDKLMTSLSASSPNLSTNQTAEKKHITICDCLMFFTRKEHIDKEYLCNDCYKKHYENGGEDLLLTSATKQTLIFNPPAILTLHLKRFELKPGGSVKRTDMITYEELLDIAPYCSSHCLRNDPPYRNIWYSLYGVVVHHGSTLMSGHYTTYVKTRDSDAVFKKFLQHKFFDRDLTREQLIELMHEKQPGETLSQQVKPPKQQGTWYCMNDSSCDKVSEAEVLNQEAYLLFYERI